jgi:dihydroorotate dehydrogenase (NAD+) catalytic subunit
MADLSITLFGHTLPNPIMPAAGPNGRSGDDLLQAARGGAGALVMKTVSVLPAPVPYPNIASVGGHSMMNAELWSELPVEQYLDKEYRIAKNAGLMLIAGLGYSAEELANLGPRVEATGCVDAFEFSIHYLGSDIQPVIDSAKALKASVSKPIMAKISPNFPDIAGLVSALEPYVDGFIAVNSLGPALDFDPETRTPFLGSDHGYGWLSGRAIFPLALRIVHQLASCTTKPVLGVGGVSTGVDAIKMIMAGAHAVQVCSAAIEEGHGVYGRIASEMSRWLDAHGFASVEEIRGLYLHERFAKTEIPMIYSVDRPRCVRCGHCLRSCIHQAIVNDADRYPVHTEKCISCGFCATVCPVKAISGK